MTRGCIDYLEEYCYKEDYSETSIYFCIDVSSIGDAVMLCGKKKIEFLSGHMDRVSYGDQRIRVSGLNVLHTGEHVLSFRISNMIFDYGYNAVALEVDGVLLRSQEIAPSPNICVTLVVSRLSDLTRYHCVH